MKSAFRLTIVAAAFSCTMATPLRAQTSDTAQELAQMRAQLEALAQRITQLEGELDQAKTKITEQETAVAAIPAAAKPDTTVAWKGAPEISGKGGWSFKPRGRLQFDAGVIDAPDSTGREDGFGKEIRRARLGVEGDIPGGFGYKFEVDFAGNEVELTDGILTYDDDGLTLTVGQHNNFQGLEELTSSRFISMMERAAFTDAFGFERRLGVSAQYGAGQFLLQSGVFSDNVDDTDSKNWSLDGRAVFMPKMGKTQLHFGGSVHYTDLESGSSVRYRQRPFFHFTSERFIDTGSLGAVSELGFGAEAAAVFGRFHAAAEAYWQNANRRGALADPGFFGGYAEVGYFLTKGDTRGYKNGTFDRVKPKKEVGEGGIGAVQLNLRYDHLDLSDAGIVGGLQDALGAALIWTPTDYTRLMLNYAHIAYDDAIRATATGERDYSVDAVGVRAQVDF
ncbi:MAG: hypothetical protein LC648_00645 [Novosphingobium sp.]|nr:hypothetical protein [Novosphingobium sp.]